MTVTIDNEVNASFDFDHEAVIEEVILEALNQEKCPYEAEVEVILTDNAGIHEINLEMRNIDSPTDVLSFPMAYYDKPADFDGLETEQDDVFNPDTGEFMMGDIVISCDKVREQAAAYGHSEKRELAFLVAHSMMHLMGYDHIKEDERLVMEDRQRKVLDTLGIGR